MNYTKKLWSVTLFFSKNHAIKMKWTISNETNQKISHNTEGSQLYQVSNELKCKNVYD